MTKQQFVSDVSHWNSYLELLWAALENTSGDVIELGLGHGSTIKLHDYCQDRGRRLFSYDASLEWYLKFEHLRSENHRIECVHNNWQVMIENHRQHIGLLFSDESPGEIRKYNIAMFCNLSDVCLAHDAEDSNDIGYRFSLVKPLFKYHKMHIYPGASTAAMSNYIDVTKWVL
jgi:hypothetical protein